MKNLMLSFLCLLISFVGFSQTAIEQTAPRAVFGELKHQGPYDRSEILLQDKLTVSSGDGNSYEIIKCNIIISLPDGTSTRHAVLGNKIPAKVQGSLNQIVAGDKVIIESIKAKITDSEGASIDLSPIVLVIGKYKKTPPVILNKNATATLGNLNIEDNPTLKEIQAQTGINIKSTDGKERIVSVFKMILAPKDGSPAMATSLSNNLSPNMITLLQRAKSGDKIIFEGIMSIIVTEEGSHRERYSPFIIVIP